MKLRSLPLRFQGSSFPNFLPGNHPLYSTTPGGTIVLTGPMASGTPGLSKLQVVANNMLRVIAATGREMEPVKSPSPVFGNRPGFSRNVITSKERFTLQTKSLTAIINLKTGAVYFRGPEKQFPGRAGNMRPKKYYRRLTFN